MKTWFTAEYVAENRTETKCIEGLPWPEDPNGWTYQEVAGFGGTVIRESTSPPLSERDVDAGQGPRLCTSCRDRLCGAFCDLCGDCHAAETALGRDCGNCEPA